MQTERERPKVLLVSPVGYVGGAERVQMTLLSRLTQEGIEPFFASLRPGPLSKVVGGLGIPSFEFGSDFRYRNLKQARKCMSWLQKLILELRIDLVHSSHIAHLLVGPVCKKVGIPEIWHVHDYPYTFNILERICRKIPTNHIIYTTERVKSGYSSLGQTTNTVINPNCVDADTKQPVDSEAMINLGLSGRSYFISSVRIQPHKGIKYLIQSVPFAARYIPDHLWVVVGEARGPKQALHLAWLKKLVSKMGLEKKILFAGFLSEEQLEHIRRNAVAMVHPAISEGYGLVLLEAMNSGVPVIATSVDGPATIIEDSINGVLVPPQDPVRLAEAMVKVAINLDFRSKLVKNGNAYVRLHGPKQMTHETASCYRTVLINSDSGAKSPSLN